MMYGIVLAKNVNIKMRDGVHLASDIYRPAQDGEPVLGTYPTILCRTPYDKSAQRYVDIADYFTPRGYIVILQDVRGRFRSEGVGQYYHTANINEGVDGYDTIEWIAAQVWSNGRVGMVGSSYPGLAQTRAALERPPHLTTIWPDVIPTNSFHHQVRMGGAMQLQMFGALFVHAMDAPEIENDPAAKEVIFDAMEHLREMVYATPFKPGHTPLRVVPNLEKTLIEYYTRGAYDEFWSAIHSDYTRYFNRHADIPIAMTGGWYDLFAESMPNYFVAMRQQNKSNVRLIMGPWTHTGMRNGVTHSGDVDYGADGAWGNKIYFAEQLRWFDHYLKSSESRVTSAEKELNNSGLSTQHSLLDDPPVTVFVMGGGDGRRTRTGKLNHGGKWRAEKEWPLARTQYTNYYLHADHSLTTQPPNHPTTQPLRFTFDPSHPVPTIGASSSGLMELVPLSDKLDSFWSKSVSPSMRLNSIVIEGAAHQKEEPGMVAARPPYLTLDMRPDVLVFQTPPLEKDVEVTGTIIVNLWISSSARDTDFTAKLVDVYPPNADYVDGYHLNLTDSIIRCRFRNSWEREEMMEPGKIYPVKISLAPTSNLFQKGHRLRVDISSSNFPRFDINPNTGEPMGRHTHTLVAHNTVYADKEHPSHVVLPIIES